ncbi:aspartic peptidase domain-containing protein [Massariosphaeria phaeospora]|uniref:Aspartic peptidase domain-containing protein n=1 Tax=Massariosphaeria phaeospora TaxID=100035 RepID=A0A7C8M1X1_9PLEO|nr:aspartic peptidase domain-containing protein [Massariosphaeria phaeospora]
MILLRVNVYFLYFVGFLVLFGNTAPSFGNGSPLVLDLVRIRGANDGSHHGKRGDIFVIQQLKRADDRLGINLKLREKTYLLHVDTGSDRTWIAQSDFVCFDLNRQRQSQESCKLGPNLFSGRYQPIEDFHMTYGGGEGVVGKLAIENVEIGGLKAKNVEIGIGEDVAWKGDGLTVGLFGISWEPDRSSIWLDICEQYYLPLQFTIAVNRKADGENNGGSLIIGGTLDGEPVNDSWETVELADKKSGSWFIDGFDLQTVKIRAKTLIDSGNTEIYLTEKPFEEFLALWEPAPKFNEEKKVWGVDCNAEGRPETLDFKIGQRKFKIPLKDNIILQWRDFCYFAVKQTTRPSDHPILGLPFMSYVTINHDWEELTMSFKQRVYP